MQRMCVCMHQLQYFPETFVQDLCCLHVQLVTVSRRLCRLLSVHSRHYVQHDGENAGIIVCCHVAANSALYCVNVTAHNRVNIVCMINRTTPVCWKSSIEALWDSKQSGVSGYITWAKKPYCCSVRFHNTRQCSLQVYLVLLHQQAWMTKV